MGDLGETWSEVTETADAAEAAARTYEQMVRSWIMADLGETWSEVAQAAGAAEAAARTYQQAKDDPARSEEERLQARSEYKQATTRLYEALRSAKVEEHDGLWNEVMDAVQRAQELGIPSSRQSTTSGSRTRATGGQRGLRQGQEPAGLAARRTEDYGATGGHPPTAEGPETGQSESEETSEPRCPKRGRSQPKSQRHRGGFRTRRGRRRPGAGGTRPSFRGGWFSLLRPPCSLQPLLSPGQMLETTTTFFQDATWPPVMVATWRGSPGPHQRGARAPRGAARLARFWLAFED